MKIISKTISIYQGLNPLISNDYFFHQILVTCIFGDGFCMCREGRMEGGRQICCAHYGCCSYLAVEGFVQHWLPLSHFSPIFTNGLSKCCSHFAGGCFRHYRLNGHFMGNSRDYLSVANQSKRSVLRVSDTSNHQTPVHGETSHTDNWLYHRNEG